ncbi:MAG: DUF6895 family protein [Blastocatellia bacterium]
MDSHPGFREEDTAGLSTHTLARLQARSRDVMEKAGLWVARCTQERLAEMGVQAQCLSLFGLSCALRASAASDQPSEMLKTADRVVEKLLDDWDQPADGLQAKFQSGIFVTAMMAAAALVSDSPTARTYRKRCRSEWASIEQSAELRARATPLWTGRHLDLVISGAPQPLHKLVPWPTEISGQPMPYTISSDGIHQIVKEIAALSAFGQTPLPLSQTAKDYLKDFIPFWTFFYIKENDLDMVAPLVRALNYLGLTTVPEYLDGLNFILQQSKDDGRFGMQEMAIHLQSLTVGGSVDKRLEIYLPLTVASLWALLDCLYPARAPFKLGVCTQVV